LVLHCDRHSRVHGTRDQAVDNVLLQSWRVKLAMPPPFDESELAERPKVGGRRPAE
jgi:hypothetical protein